MDLVDVYGEEKQCKYNGEIYSVRDNGAVMRHPKDENKPRPLDNIWTFGTIKNKMDILCYHLIEFIVLLPLHF